MTFKNFIKENRKEIDSFIAAALAREDNPYPNDRERELWVLNDEGLYNWAKSEGVKI